MGFPFSGKPALIFHKPRYKHICQLYINLIFDVMDDMISFFFFQNLWDGIAQESQVGRWLYLSQSRPFSVTNLNPGRVAKHWITIWIMAEWCKRSIWFGYGQWKEVKEIKHGDKNVKNLNLGKSKWEDARKSNNHMIVFRLVRKS